MKTSAIKFAKTPTLRIAYIEYGAGVGWPVVLSHGFPYDVRAFDEVAEILATAGARVIVPYARGFGPTRFIDASALRSGQQAARGKDIVELCDALGLQKPLIAGFDWGGNASCVAAALWPGRFRGLVSYAGYDIIDVEMQRQAVGHHLERVCWYQHLFQTERGRDCLTRSRRGLCAMLWQEWSPECAFDEKAYLRTASSFENPDFVDVVIHAYRFNFGLAPGDAALQSLERNLAMRPLITLPSVTLDGTVDPLKPGGTASHSKMFSGRHEHRVVESGHNVPQHHPQPFADAVLTVHAWVSG